MAADSLRGSAHEVAQENLRSSWKVDSHFANPLLKPVKERHRHQWLRLGPLLNHHDVAFLLRRGHPRLHPEKRNACDERMDQRFVFVFELFAQDELSVLAGWVFPQQEVAHPHGPAPALGGWLSSAFAALLTRSSERIGAGCFRHGTVVLGCLCHCNHLDTGLLWSLLLLLAKGLVSVNVCGQKRCFLLTVDLLF